MSKKSMKALQAVVADYLEGDDSAAVTVIPQKNGPDMAMIRADVLEALKFKAAQFDAQTDGDAESDDDAFTLLSKG